MKQDNGWNGFVNIRLEKHHKDAVKALVKSNDAADLVAWLSTLGDDGYKFTLTPDLEHGAVIATLIGTEAAGPNAGFAMSQRHADPVVACWALFFAHEELAQRDAWDDVAYDWRESDW